VHVVPEHRMITLFIWFGPLLSVVCGRSHGTGCSCLENPEQEKEQEKITEDL
jgi:hypothetical protein